MSRSCLFIWRGLWGFLMSRECLGMRRLEILGLPLRSNPEGTLCEPSGFDLRLVLLEGFYRWKRGALAEMELSCKSLEFCGLSLSCGAFGNFFNFEMRWSDRVAAPR